MSILDKLFKKKNSGASKKERDAQRYAVERAIAQSGAFDARMKLAKSPDTHPEILYYLAEHDMDAAIRREVAANASTPYQTNPIIVVDKDHDVRFALAERLVRLLPELSADKHSQIYAYTIDALGTLALDEVLKIRLVLSSALKDSMHAPPKVVGQLARDLEREVAEPVLRYCVALSDEDLLDIIKNYSSPWAVQAVARRKNLSVPVMDAIIEANDEPAGLMLLENKDAEIPMALLSKIVEKAMSFVSWQKPIAVRTHLPPSLAKRLADFVDQSVKNLLLERTDLDAETMEEISDIVRRRLDMAADAEKEELTAEDRVRKMIDQGTLTEEAVTDAMGVRDRDFVIVAIAAMARTNRANIEKVVALQAPKPLLAVCWKAGLSMRTAFQLEKELAHIQPKELLYPRGGTDYPLDDAELEWQLDFLGMKK